MFEATTYGGAGGDAGTSVEFEDFLRLLRHHFLDSFSSRNLLDTLALSSNNVLNDTYADSIVAQDDSHVISQPSCYRGCEPPTNMISMEDE